MGKTSVNLGNITVEVFEYRVGFELTQSSDTTKVHVREPEGQRVPVHFWP